MSNLELAELPFPGGDGALQDDGVGLGGVDGVGLGGRDGVGLGGRDGVHLGAFRASLPGRTMLSAFVAGVGLGGGDNVGLVGLRGDGVGLGGRDGVGLADCRPWRRRRPRGRLLCSSQIHSKSLDLVSIQLGILPWIQWLPF